MPDKWMNLEDAQKIIMMDDRLKKRYGKKSGMPKKNQKIFYTLDYKIEIIMCSSGASVKHILIKRREDSTLLTRRPDRELKITSKPKLTHNIIYREYEYYL